MGTESLAKDDRQEREVPQLRPKETALSGPAKGAIGMVPVVKLAKTLFTFQSWSYQSGARVSKTWAVNEIRDC